MARGMRLLFAGAAPSYTMAVQHGSFGISGQAATMTYVPTAPTGNIEQFLTSDGGTEVFSQNFSGPTRAHWHNRLGFGWKRNYLEANPLYGRGNWLDAAQVNEGSTAYASTASVSAVGQVLTANVTALVQRWRSNGLNRGFYLNTRVSAWPVGIHGRGAVASGDRPTLTVNTTVGGPFVLVAAANASWASSSFSSAPGKVQFTVAADAQPAIVRFDLSTVTGTVTSATLTMKVAALPGSAGQIVDVFEADPPTITDPVTVASPELGLLNGYADFNAFKAASLPGVKLFADDFESPGPFDTGFTPAATRTLNPLTGTIYATGTIEGGGPPGSGTSSADINKSVSVGIGATGTPDVVYTELHGHYRWRMKANFGTTADTAIKIPAMGVQFGYWNPVGYWQQTTGNGGNPGTGLKVFPAEHPGALAAGKAEYQGHSVRFLTGTEPRAGDDDPYRGWFGIGIYPYNLDQVGAYPAGEPFPWIAIRKESWYDMDIRVVQNTMSGAQDGLGNYATANADGIYQVRINGYLAYSKTNFRWRRHAEFGVQGVWVDVYHGGNDPQPYSVNYDVDQVVIATSYIGPKAAALPSYVPAPGELATLTVANGGLTNNFRDAVSPFYQAFYSVKIVNDYSGAAKNPYYGPRGAALFFGGGHSSTNDNSVMALEYGATAMTFKRVADPTNWFPSSPSTNDITSDLGSLVDSVWMDEPATQKPISIHSWGIPVIIPPSSPGAGALGSLCIPVIGAGGFAGLNRRCAHELAIPSTTISSAAIAWVRSSAASVAPGAGQAAPPACAFVPAHNRVYFCFNGGGDPGAVYWLDRATGDYVTGTGVGFNYDGADQVSGGDASAVMFHVPERDLLICIGRFAGVLQVQYMAVGSGVAQPTVGSAVTLSSPLAVDLAWSTATWCPDNARIIVAGVTGDSGAMHEIEIPSNPATSPWPVARAPLGSGQTFTPVDMGSGNTNSRGKFDYDRLIKSIVYFGQASSSGPDTVYIYRPRGT